MIDTRSTGEWVEEVSDTAAVSHPHVSQPALQKKAMEVVARRQGLDVRLEHLGHPDAVHRVDVAKLVGLARVCLVPGDEDDRDPEGTCTRKEHLFYIRDEALYWPAPHIHRHAGVCGHRAPLRPQPEDLQSWPEAKCPWLVLLPRGDL